MIRCCDCLLGLSLGRPRLHGRIRQPHPSTCGTFWVLCWFDSLHCTRGNVKSPREVKRWVSGCSGALSGGGTTKGEVTATVEESPGRGGRKEGMKPSEIYTVTMAGLMLKPLMRYGVSSTSRERDEWNATGTSTGT